MAGCPDERTIRELHAAEDPRDCNAWRTFYVPERRLARLSLHKDAKTAEHMASMVMTAEEAYEMAQALLGLYDKLEGIDGPRV